MRTYRSASSLAPSGVPVHRDYRLPGDVIATNAYLLECVIIATMNAGSNRIVEKHLPRYVIQVFCSWSKSFLIVGTVGNFKKGIDIYIYI